MADSQPSISQNNKIATRLAYVITFFWAVSFIVDIVVKTYDPSPSVHALMMIVAGAVFGEGLIRTRNGNTTPQPSKEESRE